MKQSLSFKNGVTNNPSDLVSDDNCLRASIGAEFIDGAHKPIQMPDKFQDNFNDDIIIIHDFADYTNIIAWYPGQEGETSEESIAPQLRWYDFRGDLTTDHLIENNFISRIKSAEVIGNTVVLNTDNGLLYLLWKSKTLGYKILGGQLPAIQANVFMDNTQKYDPHDGDGGYEILVKDFVHEEDGQVKVILGQEENFKNALVGIITKTENKLKKDGHFMYPFWVRLAYRLYDGKNACITNPILMLPTVRYNRYIVTDGYSVNYQPYAGDLKVQVFNDLSDWEDIIDGVDVFVSDDVRGFNLDGDYALVNNPDANTIYADYVGPAGHYGLFGYPFITLCVNPEGESDVTIINNLIKNSVFYNILEMTMSDLAGVVDVKEKMGKNVLLYLSTQTTLEHDDYFGHCKLSADTMLVYNGRLHLANIGRGFFDGFKKFISLAPSTRTADVYVEIVTPSGVRMVKQEVDNDALAYWFYYPDPRAKHAYIIIGANKYKINLTQDPWLNGAYYFGSLPSSDGDALPAAEADSTAPAIVNNPELMQSQVITSEVNNPFVYTAEGSNDVGSGRVMGITTNTQALSEGQFGQHPLIAFTDEGIWALMPNNEGVYTNTVPLPREVCSNPDSITQTDDAVFFASAKGLMILSGRRVQCVSELLNGKDNDLSPFNINGESIYLTPLREILKYGKIAYDYKGQRLWMYEGNQIWTYNIKSRTFSQIITDDPFKTHSRLYPDCIIQTESGKLLSMLNTPNINDDDDGVYSATIITRPVKLNDTFAYKTITRIGHLWLGQGNVNMEVWGSDDFTNWQHLNSLHGMPWKYYTFRLDFTGMKATDTYHGMLLEYNVRHSNRLHTAFEDSQNQDNEQGTDTTP